MKKENGITLIALVITIIVMLILVGVSVTVALNGGLFSTAQKATGDTKAERDNELALSDGKVTINGEEYNSIDEYVNGGSSNNPTQPENPTGYTAYSIGQEVTVGGENFYVIADSDETNPNVTLLSKYNLNTAGTAQSNAAYSETACAFSSTNYWASEEETEDYNNINSKETSDAYNEKWGSTYPRNLNDTPTSADTDAIAKARAYGVNLGGTGRLMTKEEAETLKTANSDILYGKNGKSSSTYLNYWLGSAYNTDSVWLVIGDGSGLSSNDCSFGSGTYGGGFGDFGVRPVVEISKSSIS